MIEADRERFATELFAVAQMQRQELSAEQLEMYWRVLSPELTLDQYLQAICKAASRLEWVPKPSQILEFAGKNSGTSDGPAMWQNIVTAISAGGHNAVVVFDDVRAVACIHRLGGWGALCSIPNEFSLQAARRDFLKYWDAYENEPVPDDTPRYASAGAGSIERVLIIGDQDKARALLRSRPNPELKGLPLRTIGPDRVAPGIAYHYAAGLELQP